MASYTVFAQQFLVATYFEASQTDQYVDSGQVLSKYNLDFSPGWLFRVLEDWRNGGLIRGKGTVGGEDQQPIYLTGAGFEQAERLIGNGVKVPEKLPSGLLLAGRTFISEGPAPEDFGGPGDVFLEMASPATGIEITNVPAADRMVPINHNAPEYQDIVIQFSNVREAVRIDNSADDSERARIIAGLDAAAKLWNALQLKAIQIKIGILMAAEEAMRHLAETAKAVVAALLVDTIKSFFKTHAGIDLDSL